MVNVTQYLKRPPNKRQDYSFCTNRFFYSSRATFLTYSEEEYMRSM